MIDDSPPRRLESRAFSDTESSTETATVADHTRASDASILIHVNGEDLNVAEEATVHDLLEQLSTPGQGVAVELNREVVPQNAHASTRLHAGDRIEVVQFVGGG